jgi:hypothetical protein
MRHVMCSYKLAVVTGCVLAFSLSAAAECVSVTPQRYRADLVFSGTFVKKDVISRWSPNAVGLVPVTGDGEEALRDRTAFGLRLTFDVQRVWNGAATKTMIVYQVLNPDSPDHWKPNTDYLILANRLSGEDRSSLLLASDEQGFIVQNCSGAWSWTAAVERDVQAVLGRGRRLQ